MNFIQRIGGALKQTFEATWSTSDPSWYARNGYLRMYEMLGGGSGTAAGISVNVPLAMQCGAAYACTRAITESMAAMPLQLLQRQGKVTRQATDSPLYQVLKARPNGYQTAKVLRRTIQHHALNYGNGYARVVRRGNDPDEAVVAIHIIHPQSIEKLNPTGDNPTFRWSRPDGEDVILQNHQVLHLMNYSDDGFSGVGAVQSGREAIALSMAIEKFGSAFFARGGVPAGMVVKEVPFRDKVDRDQFKADWTKEYEGFQGFFKKLLVEGGSWKFEKFGLSPSDSQLNDAAASMIPAICRFYGLTPHLAGDLSRAHFANVEHLWIEFLQITLMPWMVAWEQEIERVLLSKKERENGYYAKHNANSFQRGDFETRMNGYATELQNGIISINEARSFEDLDPIAGGDVHVVQLNMQKIEDIGKIKAPKPAPAAPVKAIPAPEVKKLDPAPINISVTIPSPGGKKKIIRDDEGNMTAIEDVPQWL